MQINAGHRLLAASAALAAPSLAYAFAPGPPSLASAAPRSAMMRHASERPPRAPRPRAGRSAAARHVPNFLFVECGMGCDQHGQQATRAATRACRSAIEFNSLPAMRRLVPGGYSGMKVHVQLSVPAVHTATIDRAAVAAVFPYGEVRVDVEPGGLVSDSGVALEAMGDQNSDMVLVVACVTVGF